MTRAIALGLALTIGLSVPAAAAPDSPAPDADEDPALTRAKQLYNKGRGKFDTAHYEAAIELWTEAYSTLPDDPENARTKALLIYNIARAQEQAYRVDEDITHLRQARILLQNYADNVELLYEDPQEVEIESAKVQQRLASLDEAIAEAEAAQPEQERPDEPEVVPQPVEGPKPVDDQQTDRRSKAMVGAGAGLLAVGGAGFGMMIAGLVIGNGANDIDDLAEDDFEARGDRFDRGRMGNALAITGGVVGGAFCVAGAVLVALGKRSQRTAALTPVLGPGVAGAQLRVRF